jgi:hypothetical protein
VPLYDPLVVFAPPRHGIVIGAAIGWGPAVVITAGFAPWGLTHSYFAWGAHAIVFDDTRWDRVWLNRGFYVHPRTRIHGCGPWDRMWRYIRTWAGGLRMSGR